MPVCEVCGGTEFQVLTGGYYCIECSTKTQKIREEQKDEEFTADLPKNLYLHSNSTSTRTREKKDSDLGTSWTTHEAYNAIICQQVKALIKMGASPNLKDVVLQLWASYLKQNEVAFKGEDEDTSDWEPRLSVFPRKRDVQVLTGETVICYRKSSVKKRKKEVEEKERKIKSKKDAGNDTKHAVENETVSKMDVDAVEGETVSKMDVDAVESILEDMLGTAECNGVQHLEEATETAVPYKKQKVSKLKPSLLAKKLQRKEGKKALARKYGRMDCTELMTLPKTICFSYLGLLLLNEDILLCDIIRFSKEGHFPYMDAVHQLPPSMKLQDSDWSILTPGALPNMKKIVSISTRLAIFIGLSEVPCRPLLPIAVRFIKDLGLPDELLTVVKNLLEEHPSSDTWVPFQRSRVKPLIPMFEVEAMAHILVAAKLIFGLDGKTERKLSRFAIEKNKQDSKLNFFVWDEWFLTTKLKEEFLRSRNIPSSYLNESALDVELMYSNYFDVLQSWTRRTSISKTVCKCSQPKYHEEMKRVFTDISSQSDSYNKLVCSASSFPLQSRLCQQMSLLSSCHQYFLSQPNSSSFFKNFSSCSLSFIFNYWNCYKTQMKPRRNRRQSAGNANVVESAVNSESPGNGKMELSCDKCCANGMEDCEPPMKRKQKGDCNSKNPKSKKRDKNSVLKVHKKKSGTHETNTNNESGSIKNLEDKNGKDSESKEENKNPRASVKRKKMSCAVKTKKRNNTLGNSKGSAKLGKNKTRKKVKKDEKIKKSGKEKEKNGKHAKSIDKDDLMLDGGDKPQVFSKNYWYLNFPLAKIQQAYEKLPENFRWLLHFSSEMIETTVDVLHHEVLVIERRLFKTKLKNK